MRRAMAFAINYKDIRELAVSGYSEPLKPGLIMPFGLEAPISSRAKTPKKYGTSLRSRRRARADAQAEAGYTAVFGPDGQLVETRDAQRPTRCRRSTSSRPLAGATGNRSCASRCRSMREVGIDARETVRRRQHLLERAVRRRLRPDHEHARRRRRRPPSRGRASKPS